MKKQTHILVIHNPFAGCGRSRKMDMILNAFARASLDVTYRIVRRPGDAEHIARAAALRQAYDVIVAAGGDGTLNAVANGLVGANIPVAVLPLGTGNFIARRLGMKCDPEHLVKAVKAGQVCRVPLGVCNGRHFLLCAGIGYDALALGSVEHRISPFRTRISRISAGLRAWLFLPPNPLRIVMNNRAEVAATWLLILNRFPCGADAGVGILAGKKKRGFELVILHKQTPMAIAWEAILFFIRLLANWAGFRTETPLVKAQHIEVYSDNPAPCQVDGECAQFESLNIAATDHVLNLIDGRFVRPSPANEWLESNDSKIPKLGEIPSTARFQISAQKGKKNSIPVRAMRLSDLIFFRGHRIGQFLQEMWDKKPASH